MDNTKQKRQSGYESVLDGFASELGSTLDDLDFDWDSPSAAGANGRMANEVDDFSKAQNHCISTTQYILWGTEKPRSKRQVKHPNLIPLSQYKTNKETAQEEGRKYRRGSKSKKKHGGGIFNKIASGLTRKPTRKLLVDNKELEVSSPITKSGSIHSDDSSESDLSVSQCDSESVDSIEVQTQTTSSSQLESIPEVEGGSDNPPRPTPAPRRGTPSPNPGSRPDSPDFKPSPARIPEISATAPPENEKQETSAKPLVISGETPNISTIVTSSDEKQEIPAILSPNVENLDPGSVKSLDHLGLPELKSSDRTSSHESVGSASSTGSVHSEEHGETADVTMVEVMSEVAHTNPTYPVIEEVIEPPPLEPSLLKRNKTLKWSGTRKAPALIREFTRRQKRKQKQSESSPTKSAESQKAPKPSPRKKKIESQSSESNDLGMHSDDSFSDITALDIQPIEQKSEKNKRDSAFIVLSSLLPPAPKLRRTYSSKVRAYLQKMGTNVNNALGFAVTQFVEQSLKNKEQRPLVLLHDVRSFLTDIKRYLISNPHLGLVKKIQKIVNYSSTVDVEGAVDDALDKLVLYPLHSLIYKCLVIDYTRSGQLKDLEEAIALAKTKTNQELGIRDTVVPPDAESLSLIKGHFAQLQRTYSPYFKLKELLAAVTKIYQSTKDLRVDDGSSKAIGADDFLPLLVYSIVHCDFVAADIEAQYIDGLLDPALLVGEGGYYLTTLISAVQVVFSMKRKETSLPSISDLQGFLKVGISPINEDSNKRLKKPDDDVVLHKTLHVPPAMTARNLCHMITRKFNIEAPDDYCLHVVANGIAHPLEPNECPQLVKMDLLTQFSATAFYFSYQRKNPKQDQPAQENNNTFEELGDIPEDQSKLVSNDPVPTLSSPKDQLSLVNEDSVPSPKNEEHVSSPKKEESFSSPKKEENFSSSQKEDNVSSQTGENILPEVSVVDMLEGKEDVPEEGLSQEDGEKDEEDNNPSFSQEDESQHLLITQDHAYSLSEEHLPSIATDKNIVKIKSLTPSHSSRQSNQPNTSFAYDLQRIRSCSSIEDVFTPVTQGMSHANSQISVASLTEFFEHKATTPSLPN
uniref:ras and Rab interactor 2-like isoform X2 n=1 Tax=Ciona intestinalis TaxID=7719 RepID=UPI0005215812|nr:ras and Rab interactor 2-like isoform X2 [Ciona intestinalis]|eukprot:XP_026692509.1 ras and Rab interactor 2-like isoform X2 [Ciona intestinalis]